MLKHNNLLTDEIGGRVPVNKTAAIVVSRGFQYSPDKKIQTADSDTPIPVRKCPKFIPDLKGKRRGRLTVVGLSVNKKKGKAGSTLWVMRCDCGVYTERTSKAVNNENNDCDACEHCRHLAYLKRKGARRDK